MQTVLLINRAKISQYKQISKSTFDEVLNQHISEAQRHDLKPLLGERLYNDLITNPSAYTDLLEGGTYVYNGITYINEGVEMLLSYYVYSRYAMFGSVTDTPFSMVEKLNGGESKPVDSTFKKSLYQMNRDMAYNIWLTVESYLRRTENPLFIGNCIIKKTNFKFSKIR